MTMKYVWLFVAAFAVTADATCASMGDIGKQMKACVEPYTAAVAADKCAALGAYVKCYSDFAATCTGANAAMLSAFTTAKDTALKVACSTVCAGQAVCGAVTTTLTPWDSSASSGSDVTSLKSSYSSSFKKGLSGDSSGSNASSGSTGSGSSGSYMRTWQWLLLIGLCCCCCAGAGGAAAMGKKKPKKKKPTPKPPAPAPAPAPAPEVIVEPLLPPIMPLATTSNVIPSYSMAIPTPTYAPVQTYAAPATTAYAAPATTAYAAPATTAYAAPATYSTGYAAPATYSAGYAAPATYSTGYTTGYGGYGAGTVL